MSRSSFPPCLPEICGRETEIARAIADRSPAFAPQSPFELARIECAFALALHMHQPTIPAGGDDMKTARLISNLEHMLQSNDRRTRRRAAGFAQCYLAPAQLIRELVDRGKHPRIMLDYSGNLLWAFEQAGRVKILDALRSVTTDPVYQPHVEWLGTTWSHAVASSTPPADFKLHLRAWQTHFISLFGEKTFARIRGFSPPEMQLPNDPDLAYAYVESLLECGYRWVLVQEDTVEQLDGTPVDHPHRPHRLVTRNSEGKEVAITALIKTQESNIELIARMQPLDEARRRANLLHEAGRYPNLVTQISDGENSRTILTVFPDSYREAISSLGTTGVVAMNGTEYLELLEAAGWRPDEAPPIQPILQHKIWALAGDRGRPAIDRAIQKLSTEDEHFQVEGKSWVRHRSWVDHYGTVVKPMSRLSARFHETFDGDGADTAAPGYREALLYLLLSQTSCFRYWGQGTWTEFGLELCRRGEEVLDRRS